MAGSIVSSNGGKGLSSVAHRARISSPSCTVIFSSAITTARQALIKAGFFSGASSFKAYKNKKGCIVLEPQVEVPAAEAWLWKNPVAMKAVQQGLKDSAEGKLVDRGTFAPYADEADE